MKNKLLSLRIIPFLGLIFFSFQLSAQEIREQLPDFNEVKTFNGVEVVLVPSRESRIEITGESREKVKYEVDNYSLEIKLSFRNIWDRDNTKITVYVENLKIIDANESSIVEVSGELKTNSFIFRAQEGAAIYAKIDAEKVTSKAITGGLIQLQGKAQRQDIEINTGGKFFGKNLKTASTEVYTSTGGQAEVFATEFCDATAKLGGKVIIFGDPEKIDKDTGLGGKIIKMN